MSFKSLKNFKEGQLNTTEDCKSKSETEHSKLDVLRAFVVESYGEVYGEGYADYVARCMPVVDALKERAEMKAVLSEIIKKIKAVNDKRLENRERVESFIAGDDTNEEILWILRDYFEEELESGQDIDSDEFLRDKFGTDFQKIRDAEAGIY